MKKNIILTTTILGSIIVFTAALIGVLGILKLNAELSLKHFFDDWKPQTDEEVLDVLWYDSWYYEDELTTVDISGNIDEIYCVKSGRVYFAYTQRTPENSNRYDLRIGSVELNGTDFRDHNVSVYITGSYVEFSYNYRAHGTYGGLYQEGKIFLYGEDKTIAYDIETDTITEIESIPTLRYQCVIENAYTITVEDTLTKETRTITLDALAEKNEYANKISELKSKKSWDREAYTDRLFADIRVIDGSVYLICDIFNYHGNCFAVLFRYDFETDQLYYLSSVKSLDPAESVYTFAPIYD